MTIAYISILRRVLIQPQVGRRCLGRSDPVNGNPVPVSSPVHQEESDEGEEENEADDADNFSGRGAGFRLRFFI